MPEMISLLKPDDTLERCGFVLNGGALIEVDNVHVSPELGFSMRPEDVILHTEGDAIGTWHTHPAGDPNLSNEDYAGFMQWPNLTHWIIGVRGGERIVAGYHVKDGFLVKL